MRCAIAAALCLGMTAQGCSKKSQQGLPPATDWSSDSDEARLSPGATRSHPHGEIDDPDDPPQADDIESDDPHAGLDMANPHGDGDVTGLGLAAPDPDRAIDPSQRVTGVITVVARARQRVRAGTAVFLIVKRAGADGAPSGPPLAVDKLTWGKDGLAFELSDAQAMIAGTQLTGDVVVMARYDQDGDALTRQPGDITGQVRVQIPAEHIQLSLDTVLP